MNSIYWLYNVALAKYIQFNTLFTPRIDLLNQNMPTPSSNTTFADIIPYISAFGGYLPAFPGAGTLSLPLPDPLGYKSFLPPVTFVETANPDNETWNVGYISLSAQLTANGPMSAYFLLGIATIDPPKVFANVGDRYVSEFSILTEDCGITPTPGDDNLILWEAGDNPLSVDGTSDFSWGV